MGGGGAITTNSHALTNPYLPTVGPPLKNQEVYLNIQRFHSETQNVDCENRGTQKIIPKGKNPTANDGSDYGLKIITTITYNDNNNTAQKCSGETILKPDGDPYAPAAVTTDPVAPIAPLAGYINNFQIFLNNRDGNIENLGGSIESKLSSGEVIAAIAFNEPAVVVSCTLKHSSTNLIPPPTGNYPLCNTIDSIPENTGSASVVETYGNNVSNQTGIKLQMSGLVKGRYTLSFVAFDQAQNSTRVSTQFCVKEECPSPAPACPAATTDNGCSLSCLCACTPVCDTTTYCPDAAPPGNGCGSPCPTGTKDCSGGPIPATPPSAPVTPGTSCGATDINCRCGAPFPHFDLVSDVCTPSCGMAGVQAGVPAYSTSAADCTAGGYQGSLNAYKGVCCTDPLSTTVRTVRNSPDQPCEPGFREKEITIDATTYDIECEVITTTTDCVYPKAETYCDDTFKKATSGTDCEQQEGTMPIGCTDERRAEWCDGEEFDSDCGDDICVGTKVDGACAPP
ncbi:MAG: hypothetical protein SGI74_14340 [Oligoflexia bacterium]|nr:hypothetical protein [Oligoflexia bacterium]